MKPTHSREIRKSIQKTAAAALASGLLIMLTVLLSVNAGGASVYASELTDNGIDPNRTGSITLSAKEEESIEGTTFRLYKVADLEDDMTFEMTAVFANSGVDITPVSLTEALDQTAAKWMDASTELERYARENGITPDSTSKLHNLQISFSDLSLGLYLIQGDTAKEGNRTVTYQPVLICIPQRNSAMDDWKYDIVSEVKGADPTYTSEEKTTEETGTTETTGTVKTGDSAQLAHYLGLMVAAAAVLFLILPAYRRRHSDGA